MVEQSLTYPLEDRRALEIRLGSHVLRVERTETGAIINLTSAAGGRPLEIAVTPEGPVLRVGGGLSIAVDGALSIDAETLSFHARRALNLSSDGTVAIQAGDDLRTTARAQEIRSTLGDVSILANDDVVVDGERIKLNCS